ncbi:hypothetical protein CLA01_42160 [Chryseobacterium lathyri]|jgi:hypothetical protein|uniref:Uncharacterized protein n=1 Tax=Chryseobacterium lathyri TaxID=395933 RepID=A0A511YG16_9FLAO|nr:hypothetical protein CLA01_42160 [Chryseobacterium lathyri]
MAGLSNQKEIQFCAFNIMLQGENAVHHIYHKIKDEPYLKVEGITKNAEYFWILSLL